MEMGRPGRKRRLVLEDEYWKLMAAGVGTGEACRRLGLSNHGYYWRSQRGGLARTVRAEDSRSGRYLSMLERERIAVLRVQGCSMREVARRLGRAASTVSRELRRNMREADDGVYARDWRTPAPANARVGCAAASRARRGAAGNRASENLSCSGVPSRSLPGCGASIPGSRGGRPIAPFVDS